jgi:ribosome biogenesis GTPase
MSEIGLVIARYKRHALVESAPKTRHLCQFQSRALNPVVGDQVSWLKESKDTGTISLINTRSSVLRRINNKGKPETVASNLTQLVIVIAETPTPDWFLLDRYLVAAEIEHLKATIIFNKLDLTETIPPTYYTYEKLGYSVAAVSAHKGTGLSAFSENMIGERSVIIGQSGVGKSSLINMLMGDNVQKVGKLSDKSQLGRHTTTTATLHRLPNGGELIDSPGVRDYAPYIDRTQQIQQGFRELLALSENCRFSDCHHFAEPNCEIKAALADGRITSKRYKSYKQLFELKESLKTYRNQ